MKRVFNHVVMPAALPLLFFAVTAIPVEVIGCRNRGLAAVSLGLISALAGLGSVTVGLVKRMRGDASSYWWLVTTLILVIPAVAMVLIAR